MTTPFTKAHVLIVGEIMLDRFVYGKVGRISPEAPVPILLHESTKFMLGGAGNVAANIRSLGANVSVFATVGRDSASQDIARLLKAQNIDGHLFSHGETPTIVKTRFIAGKNHILRVDHESSAPTPYKPTADFKRNIDHIVSQVDIVLISDYGKGFVSKDVCRLILNAAKKSKKIVLVDPKGTDYDKYAGATLVKPNLKEFSEATGQRFDPKSKSFPSVATAAGRNLCAKHSIGALLVTLSEHGMLFIPADANRESIHLPTEAREVFDVSGAGDTTLAALAIALTEGKDMKSAMRFANAAAGVVVAKLGTATATRDEIARATKDDSSSGKILSRKELKAKISRLRQEGKCIGFTNGCFDCCHLGHISSLQEARKLCDVLVVGVNSDKWIRRNKGPNRPIQDEKTRTALLAALTCVDYVTVFSEQTALPLVRTIKPDVIAKEGYSLDQWPEGQFVDAHGGHAISLKRVAGYSTTALFEKMKK